MLKGVTASMSSNCNNLHTSNNLSLPWQNDCNRSSSYVIASSKEDLPFPYFLLGGCLSILDRLVDFKGAVFFYSAGEDLD